VDWVAIQKRLNDLGATPPLVTDGIPGPMTTGAVKAFQANHGLTSDGIVGPATLAALGLSGMDPTKGTAKGIKPSVVLALPQVFGKWEGAGLPYMYTDSKGFVTTGTGNLIDPIGAALSLPWKRPDGSLASQSEITDAWNAVKAAWPGVQSTACASLTTLRLDAQGRAALIKRTLDGYYTYLRGKYPNFDSWPADAQMAVLSISWAWGPGFASVWGANGQAFNAAINAGDFVTAGNIMRTASVHEESVNPGIVPRNAANQVMFANAANVVRGRKDPDSLYYPTVVQVTAAAAGGAAVALAGLGVWWWMSQSKKGVAA
jgi:GH24 family phage-related lysozyme (muramidase)